MQRRRPRSPRTTVIATAALAVVTAGYVLVRALAGAGVPAPALVVALAASWLCALSLVLEPGPRTQTVRAPGASPATADGRERDPITGLPYFVAARDDRFVARTGDRPGAVLVVELVDHVAASAIAPAVADRLVADAAARVSAAGSTYGAVARRLNGPRLALLVPGLDEPTLAALAVALHDGGSAALDHASHQARLVVGVAVAADGVEVDSLVRWATTAAGQAKRGGTEAPVVFHDRLADEARERLAVGRALRAAIDERNIGLVYQPQIDLTDGSLLGVEALARWHDAVLGDISPDRFVRVAAEIGMSGQLDRLVFEKALAQLGEWDVAGLEVPRVLINVTPETIEQGLWVRLGRLLSDHRVDAERITVEVVGGPHFDDGRGSTVVQHCRDLGCEVVLDHFGADAASLDQLTELPVTGLKLDRALLSGAESAALGAVVAAGTERGLAVGAVGIETAAQRDLLRGLGCVAGQGYLYAPPLDPGDLAEWMRVPHPAA